MLPRTIAMVWGVAVVRVRGVVVLAAALKVVSAELSALGAAVSMAVALEATVAAAEVAAARSVAVAYVRYSASASWEVHRSASRCDPSAGRSTSWLRPCCY
jgi:hypothetical protein